MTVISDYIAILYAQNSFLAHCIVSQKTIINYVFIFHSMYCIN